jgi:two-component system chemotaxis response regulator CheB
VAAKRDIVVIGGSAGSIGGLKEIVRSMPSDLPAAVFVVLHLAPHSRSYLPSFLEKVGLARLPVHDAVHDEAIVKGNIYVAPPDRHLILVNNRLHVTTGPKEGLQRPSINVTFRSAAACCGRRVVGILLSGMLDDGASGILHIARQGGVTIVQDPREAEFPSMPLNALLYAAVDYKQSAVDIGPTLTRLVHGELVTDQDLPSARGDKQEVNRMREFTGFTCPECRRPLYFQTHEPAAFKCRVGHVLTPLTLLSKQSSVQERKLYEAMVAIEEGADAADLIAARSGPDTDRDRLRREAQELRRDATVIRKLLEARANRA